MASDPDYVVVRPTARRKRSRDELGEYVVHRSEKWVSIKHRSSGEVMHSVSDPREEAEALYVGQASLRERLRETSNEPLVIWDVGLGAATNAMAALKAFEDEAGSGTAVRPLRIVSFENDLDSVKLALTHRTAFPHLYHQAPGALVENHRW
jgi:queuine tRNA-ribosyltransferase